MLLLLLLCLIYDVSNSELIHENHGLSNIKCNIRINKFSVEPAKIRLMFKDIFSGSQTKKPLVISNYLLTKSKYDIYNYENA